MSVKLLFLLLDFVPLFQNKIMLKERLSSGIELILIIYEHVKFAYESHFDFCF